MVSSGWKSFERDGSPATSEQRLISYSLGINGKVKQAVAVTFVVAAILVIVGSAGALMGVPYIVGKGWPAIFDATKAHPQARVLLPLGVFVIGFLFYQVRTHIPVIYGLFEVTFGGVASAAVFSRGREDGLLCGLIIGTSIYVVVRGWDNLVKGIAASTPPPPVVTVEGESTAP